MNHGAVAFVGFFVARGDCPDCLDFAEEVFDEMAPSIDVEVAGDGLFPIGFGWNDGKCASLVQFGAQRIAVEGFVSQKRFERDVLDQRIDAYAVVTLAGHQNEAGQIAECIDQRQDFGRQSSARPADRLILSPPFAPAPCWWTRTIVPSIITYSKSGSPDKVVKIFSNSPFNAHRRKRWKTEFHCPNATGRSRHGAPVRAIQSTASRKRRLSAPERPRSPGLPGSSGATRFHCASLNILRLKTALRFPVSNQISHSKGIPGDHLNVNTPRISP